jgi:hypothetical protein
LMAKFALREPAGDLPIVPPLEDLGPAEEVAVG